MTEKENPGIRLEVFDKAGFCKAWTEDKERAVLAFEGIYEEGDVIRLSVPQAGCHYIVRIDDTMDEALVFLTEFTITFIVPFGEKKKSYNPKSFSRERHYLTCRKAEAFEWNIYRNLAKNVMDQHGENGCYPHASANVETRGESVFAARNAIDGIVANTSHGSWPFESWGINRREDAEMLLEFSDGSQEVLNMEKQQKPHVFPIVKTKITWIKMKEMKKADDPSPFPALTQIEVYGKPATP